MRRPFYLNDVKLEMVRSYKYLGFLITPSGEIRSGLKDLRDRAFKFCVKNWERIRLGIGNEILIKAYKEGEESWDRSIGTLLETNGMLNFYVDNPVSEFPFIYKGSFKDLAIIFMILRLEKFGMLEVNSEHMLFLKVKQVWKDILWT